MVGDQHYPFKEGDQIKIMPEKDRNRGRREDTKLQFTSPKIAPYEVLFSLQESKESYGCYSSLM